MAEFKEIFDFLDYKDYVNHWVDNHPSGPRGRYRAMSEHLGVGTVLISQIFKGDRDLTPDQSFLLAEHMNLLELEKDYFLKLVSYSRAGNFKFKDHLKLELQKIKNRSRLLKERLKPDTELTQEQKAQFYSSWYYSAIRTLASISDYKNAEALALRLKLPIETVKSAVSFLLEAKLLILENGLLRAGPQFTHLESDSPFIKSRQVSWRVKAFDNMDQQNLNDLYFTSVVAISKKDIEEIRKHLVRTIEDYMKIVKPSPEEELACLNIDWFKV